MKRKLAIFDIDGTVYRSGLFIDLLNELVAQGTFPKRILKEAEEDYVAWVNRKGTYMKYAIKIVDIFESEIKGSKEVEVRRAVKKVLSEKKDKLYKYTRNLIKDLKKKNYLLVAISASPEIIIKEFCQLHGFDKYYSTEHEVKDGLFTGKSWGVKWDKEKVVNAFFENNPEFVNTDSIGVGDTQNDISFLKRVKNPIAFNPNAELAKHAKEKGWKIVVERKDVIYEIKKLKFLNINE